MVTARRCENMANELNKKQKMFADSYILTGNATQSYIEVYNCTYANAMSSSSELLRNPKVKKYIASINRTIDRKTKNNKIAEMKEVKEFWTTTLRDETKEMKDRLKASEMIAKTNGAFIEKVVHSGSVAMPNIVIKKTDKTQDETDT
jgi:phage terminase small subunit